MTQSNQCKMCLFFKTFSRRSNRRNRSFEFSRKFRGLPVAVRFHRYADRPGPRILLPGLEDPGLDLHGPWMHPSAHDWISSRYALLVNGEK